MGWWLQPEFQNPDLQVRLAELRGRIKGCVYESRLPHGDSKYDCKRFCPKSESINHAPIIEDIFHVCMIFTCSGTSDVCQTSGCKSTHVKCQDCDAEFADKYFLNKHMESIHKTEKSNLKIKPAVNYRENTHTIEKLERIEKCLKCK